MTLRQRIKELEKQLEDAKREQQSPPLVIIGGKPQSIKYHGNFDKPKLVYQGKYKQEWIRAIPLIEVEEK